MVRILALVGILSFSILWTGLVAEAHDGKEHISQEIEHVQNWATNEQESIQNKNNSNATHKKDKCCDEDKESN
ncbi:hypothetical protein [Pelosinus sp. sgz500959]|uniref:hypothetical protein n=1 Tax=Pelosinus sp. sgz500959 TaxID=3242472 RepID=UPI003672EB6C